MSPDPARQRYRGREAQPAAQPKPYADLPTTVDDCIADFLARATGIGTTDRAVTTWARHAARLKLGGAA